MNDTDRRYREQLEAEVTSHRTAASDLAGQISALENQRLLHEQTADRAADLLAHIERKDSPNV
jgi:hypothetical protein